MTDVKVVAPMNMGTRLVWDEASKKYNVDVDDLIKRIDALDSVSKAGDVVVLTGEIAHGGTIPLPAGFTQEQCKWVVIPRAMYVPDGYDISNFQVYADANRKVALSTEYGVHSGNRATYMVIGSR